MHEWIFTDLSFQADHLGISSSRHLGDIHFHSHQGGGGWGGHRLGGGVMVMVVLPPGDGPRIWAVLGAGGSCSCRYDHVSTAQAQQVYTVHCTVTVHCAPWPWLSRVRTQHPPQRWPEDFPRAVSMSIVTYGPMFKIGFQIPLPSTLSSATTDRPCCTGEHDSVCTLHTCIMHCHCIKIKNLPIAHKYLETEFILHKYSLFWVF